MGKIEPIREEIQYWQRVSQLEAGRAEVLRYTAQGAPIGKILNTLCQRSEEFNPAMKTSVLLLNQDNQTLHPIASVSLPQEYCDALEGVKIGIGVGSCGTAAFSKKRVIVEDINNHPYWSQYKQLALRAGLQSCWSEPIIGANGKVFGTFAIYYNHPHKPTKKDLHFIETSANLAAVVFENNATREQLTEANRLLSQTIDKRNQELKQVNQKLSALIEKQSQNAQLKLETEKEITVKELLSGFAHEMNTPLGVALTAISSGSNDIDELLTCVKEQQLTQSQAIRLLEGLSEKAELSQSSLFKACELIRQFKAMDSVANYYSDEQFDVQTFLADMKDTIHHELGFTNLSYDCPPNVLCHSRYALKQLLLSLAENSVQHGFNNSHDDQITIGVSHSGQYIHVTYCDNGTGIAKKDRKRVFEPFYSPHKSKGHVGLGLNIIRNIVYSVFQGSIELVDSPVGVRFQVSISKRSS